MFFSPSPPHLPGKGRIKIKTSVMCNVCRKTNVIVYGATMQVLVNMGMEKERKGQDEGCSRARS